MHMQARIETEAAYRTVFETAHGRIGELRLQNNRNLSTPVLFPVINFLTGTSTRGGGVWKYILKNLMQRQTPMLSQVLHFLDFNFTGRYLAKWREKSMRAHYRERNGEYDGVLFLDSGGFKLLYNNGLALETFGIHKETEADDILDLQLDFEGDIVASLDYPLPPNLARNEATARMEQSLANAVRAAERLTENGDREPYLYCCCHGQSEADIANYVTDVFERIGGKLPSFGLAVGSLVPLRGRDDSAVMERLNGVIQAIPDARRHTTPVHAFGVSGTLMPLLAYIGVDSFDSSGYVQTSRSLTYVHPHTRQKLKIMEMDTVNCTCEICEAYPLDEIQQAFMDKQSYKATSTGKFKSEYYAAIALHNFHVETEMLADMRDAIQADDAVEGLIRHIAKYPRARGLQRATAWLSEKDTALAIRFSRTLIQIPSLMVAEGGQQNPNQLQLFSLNYGDTSSETPMLRETEKTISLAYTPDNFRIPAAYQPPAGKTLLLAIPCAGKKPYSLSRTHTIVANRLQTAFGEEHQRIHKITLSGLYGPVPEEFESEEAVIRYDFQLLPQNAGQIQLCAKRFVDYLQKNRDRYALTIGYATSKAYREVFSLVAKRYTGFILLPSSLKQKRLSEFFRHVHLDALVEVIREKL